MSTSDLEAAWAPPGRLRSAGRIRLAGRRTLPAAAALVVSGCFGGQVEDPFRGGSDDGETIRVEVQNLNFNDATVFAMRSGQQVRLGRVTGKSDQMFTVPWNFALPISFRIDIVGGQSCRTPSLGVDPGSRVWVQVPSAVGLSNCTSGRR